jgi:hypothetical protein
MAMAINLKQPVRSIPGFSGQLKGRQERIWAQAILKISGTSLNNRTAVVSTKMAFNISNLPNEKYDYIINLHRINDIIKLNDFLMK